MPRMKPWSRWSIVDVMSVAASESVLAIARRSEPSKINKCKFTLDGIGSYP